MNKERAIKDWQRMYDSLTDPDIKARNRRIEQRKQRLEEKKSDTGL